MPHCYEHEQHTAINGSRLSEATCTGTIVFWLRIMKTQDYNTIATFIINCDYTTCKHGKKEAKGSHEVPSLGSH